MFSKISFSPYFKKSLILLKTLLIRHLGDFFVVYKNPLVCPFFTFQSFSQITVQSRINADFFD